MKAGKNKAFVSLPSATLEGYELPSGIIVAPDLNKRQEDNAAVIGYVVAADPALGLKEGDKVAVNYMVTSKGTWVDDNAAFEAARAAHDDERRKIFRKVRSGGMMEREGKFAVEQLGKVDKNDYQHFVHERVWVIDDKLVWEAGLDMIIAVWRDEWLPVSGHALLRKVEEKVGEKVGSVLIPEIAQAKEVKGRGVFVSGDCDVPVGATVVFDKEFASLYKFEDGEEYIVIQSRYIQAYIN